MYKRLFTVLFAAALGGTTAIAQRADNYLPTNNRNVKLTETNLPIAFINVGGKTKIVVSRPEHLVKAVQ